MWNPRIIDTDIALYTAIADALERDVRNGTLKPGDKLPTHRELADIIGVNVTTITRAYKDAERRGLITGTVGRGTYISADTGVDPSMAQTEVRPYKAIEMGLVLPLYISEPDISKIVEKIAKDRNLNRYMRYTDPLGLPEHRETGASWVRRFGIGVSRENILVSAGAQHALTCCLSSLFKAGDRIATDYLIYPGMKAIARILGLKLEPVMMDDEGMIPGELEKVCRRNPVKGIYLMPNQQNPTASAMSMQRKRELADIILHHGLTLIEDDIYSFTDPENCQAITPLAPENSVYIAGLSKAFYAGLRVAFVTAPGQLLHKIGQAIVNTIWMAPALNVATVCEVIRDGSADRIMAAKREEASSRFRRLEEKLGGYSISGKSGGFFIWLTLPHEWSGKEFELTAREKGVNVFCAERFAVGGLKAPSAVRISLSGTETMEEFERGLDILKSILMKKASEYDGFMGLEPIL